MTIAIGALVGLLLGLCGSGGSILAVPLFIVFLQLPPLQAIALSLGLVASSAFYGVFCKRYSGEIQWRTGLLFAVVGSAFTPLGLAIGSKLAPDVLVTSFAILIAVVAILMWKKSNRCIEPHQQAPAKQGSWFTRSATRRTASLLAGAVVTGTLAGLFGVGGGFIIVPILMYLLASTLKQAVATSLLIISLVAGTGFANSLFTSHNVPITLLLEVVGGGILGMTLGLYISKKICTNHLQKTFSVVALVMAALVVGKHFS